MGVESVEQVEGSPPRVRSRRRGRRGRARRPGITSACAEQTAGKYLQIAPFKGSPPRVRSRRPATWACTSSTGITSACAEQTHGCTGHSQAARDHLRVCGADPSLLYTSIPEGGSPPRVRSRLSRSTTPPRAGITSACAEQTVGVDVFGQWDGDHLRVCGADYSATAGTILKTGSPPRVRSRPDGRSRVCGGVGITSACAEQTSSTTPSLAAAVDHLRVCGADRARRTAAVAVWGSPPRVRSRRA